jgi:tetratricopeptide (TPR) repeat protein
VGFGFGGGGLESSLQNLKQLILEKTQGTPFFMEEIVQELMEQGVLVRDGVGAGLVPAQIEGAHPSTPLRTGSGTPLQIPSTVQAILAARIDRLAPDEKALLQQLSVIGREFSLSLVRQVITQPEADLYRLLASLQRKEFLYEQPAIPEVEYIFKHALTQEVAYGTVLHEQRKLLHERTGHALEVLYAATLPEHYSDLAHHYRRSPNTEKAIEYLQKAGQQAVQRSANAEAISHFTTALALLKTQPDTLERAQQELTLQLALAPPLRATKGLTAPEAAAVSSRALELSRQVGETPQLVGALASALPFYLIRAELQTARELAEQLISLAQRTQDPALLLDAHWNLAMVLYSFGEWSAARAHFEQAIALYDPGRRRAAIARVGIDFGVSSLSYLATVLWVLGYPDQARTRSRAGLSLAQETAHPDTTALAWLIDFRLYQFLREARTVQQRAEAVIMLCDEQGLAVSPWGIVAQGWALSMQGQAEEGIKQIQQGMAALRAAGAEFLRPYHLALLAEAYGKTGQVENGLTVLAEALAVIDKSGERVHEAEVYRIKGELLLQQARQRATGNSQKTVVSSQSSGEKKTQSKG